MPTLPHPTSSHTAPVTSTFVDRSTPLLALLLELMPVLLLTSGMMVQNALAKPANIDAPQKATPMQLTHITRETFLAYNDVNDFIAQSPVVTRLAPPNLKDIATHGPEVVKVIQGADCNRDGEVDTHKQCVRAFYQLWIRFNR